MKRFNIITARNILTSCVDADVSVVLGDPRHIRLDFSGTPVANFLTGDFLFVSARVPYIDLVVFPGDTILFARDIRKAIKSLSVDAGNMLRDGYIDMNTYNACAKAAAGLQKACTRLANIVPSLK